MPVRSELLPEIVYRTKQFEYTHFWNLLVIGIGFLLCSILPGAVPYPELTLITYTSYARMQLRQAYSRLEQMQNTTDTAEERRSAP
jgi:hypothetical protein